MCTDEQWTRKDPTKTIMTSEYWIGVNTAPSFKKKQWYQFWLTPLDVPEEETEWYMQYPSPSAACQTHIPAKLK